ncbi:MAG: hypothetical protein ACRDTJ_21610, partial [Pseudonocardiaceae bacterium]
PRQRLEPRQDQIPALVDHGDTPTSPRAGWHHLVAVHLTVAMPSLQPGMPGRACLTQGLSGHRSTEDIGPTPNHCRQEKPETPGKTPLFLEHCQGAGEDVPPTNPGVSTALHAH